jgi:hypothetical protein
MRSVFVAAAVALSGSAVSAELLQCNACMAATTELLKRTPILQRANARSDDKNMAVFEGLEQFCSTYNFHAYTADPSAFAAACKSFLASANENGELTATLVDGADAAAVCGSVCADVPEGERLTSYTPEPKKKGSEDKSKASKGSSKSSARKGSVDDPAYKEALKRKAARDARRGRKGDGNADEEL